MPDDARAKIPAARPFRWRRHFPLLILIALALAPLEAAAKAQVPRSAEQIRLSYAPVVAKAAPAVVNIYATTVRQRVSPFADDPFFSEFFRDFAGPPRVQNSLGSGVLVGGGLVVTNHHVVERASRIRVVLADRREYAAEVALADKAADLAVLRLTGAEGVDLPVIEIGDSDALEVGDLVLAIGNPFGVGQTVSSGIISGLARSGRGGGLFGPGSYFIQTDAPINPGNSGGALVDMNGRLIGINTMIVTRSGGSVGLGFAIPANLVRQVVAQARAGNSRFERPWAGIEVQEVGHDIAEALGMKIPHGLLIRALDPESPFARAGLRPGDVLLEFAGQPVNAAAELEFRMATQPLDGTADAAFLRDGRRHSVRIALMPPPAAQAGEEVTITAPGPFQGRRLARLTPALAARLGLSRQMKGVVVTGAPRHVPRSAIRTGDVILAVNGRPVTTPAEIGEIARTHRGWWRIDLIRGNRHITLRTNR